MIKVIWEILPALTAFQALQARLRDLRPAWQSLVVYLRRAVEEQFASQGGRFGTPWEPLSIPYERDKAGQYPGQPILRASDAMFQSLVGQTEDSIVETEPQTLTYGTRDRKARYHQRGTPRMPRRVILATNAEDRRMIKMMVRRHLENQAFLGGFERA